MSKTEIYRDSYKIPNMEVLDMVDVVTLVTFKVLPLETTEFDVPDTFFRINMYKNSKLIAYHHMYSIDRALEEQNRFRDRMGRLQREYLNFQKKEKRKSKL